MRSKVVQKPLHRTTSIHFFSSYSFTAFFRKQLRNRLSGTQQFERLGNGSQVMQRNGTAVSLEKKW